VTLYERFASPQPVGAGIMLQPTGQAVLERLGLYEEVLARGERLAGLRVDHPGGKLLLELQYSVVDPAFYGVGLHRGVLFEVLFAALKREKNIRLRLGVTGEGLRRAADGRFYLLDSDGTRHGPHDLIALADGARSRMRDDTGLARCAEPYPWGALWCVAEDPEHVFKDVLYQVVEGTRRMLGLLPSGLGPRGESRAAPMVPLVSIYWSAPASSLDEWRSSGFPAWKEDLLRMAPHAEALFDQIESPDDVLFSGYHDVVMRPWNTRAVVHVGDAAHAMSPQLGQGANLALWDAMVLADCIAHEGSALVCALDRYSRLRRDHLAYYQLVTRALTPFFQSDHDALGWLRDVFMPLAGRFRIFQRAMVMGMTGTADGHPWKDLALPPGR